MLNAFLPTLTRSTLTLTPCPVLELGLDVIVCRMARRHPRLFRHLSQMKPAIVHIEPTDLPHRFALMLGREPPTMKLLSRNDPSKPDACIRGELKELLAMLEGQTDGDTLFFSRGITIAGNTSVVVALRNTLDREEIHLMDDILSFAGPLQKPAAAAIAVLDRLVKKAAA